MKGQKKTRYTPEEPKARRPQPKCRPQRELLSEHYRTISLCGGSFYRIREAV